MWLQNGNISLQFGVLSTNPTKWNAFVWLAIDEGEGHKQENPLRDTKKAELSNPLVGLEAKVTPGGEAKGKPPFSWAAGGSRAHFCSSVRLVG